MVAEGKHLQRLGTSSLISTHQEMLIMAHRLQESTFILQMVPRDEKATHNIHHIVNRNSQKLSYRRIVVGVIPWLISVTNLIQGPHRKVKGRINLLI